MPARGKEFPSLAQRYCTGYIISIPVLPPGAAVKIPPPRRIVPEETDVWPAHCFQMLLVASEYCAALLEFMTWSFPENPRFPSSWGFLKAKVAGYARQLIRESAVVPPQNVVPGSLLGWQQLNAHSVWAAFTYCYFHGLAPSLEHLSAPAEWKLATDWLHRHVGSRGWQTEGPVYGAAAAWSRSMLDRLERAFPGRVANWTNEWAHSHSRGETLRHVHRQVVQRGDIRGEESESRYFPIYPMRMTGGLVRNQLKWKVGSVKAPRTVSGTCGVPYGFSQSLNCALGYLVLSDVIGAFKEAMQPGSSQEHPKGLLQHVMQEFLSTVVSSDDAELPSHNDQHSYACYMATCALGWGEALLQVPYWLTAAADSAAAVGLNLGRERELILAEEMALPGLQDVFKVLQQRHPEQVEGGVHSSTGLSRQQQQVQQQGPQQHQEQQQQRRQQQQEQQRHQELQMQSYHRQETHQLLQFRLPVLPPFQSQSLPPETTVAMTTPALQQSSVAQDEEAFGKMRKYGAQPMPTGTAGADDSAIAHTAVHAVVLTGEVAPDVNPWGTSVVTQTMSAIPDSAAKAASAAGSRNKPIAVTPSAAVTGRQQQLHAQRPQTEQQPTLPPLQLQQCQVQWQQQQATPPLQQQEPGGRLALCQHQGRGGFPAVSLSGSLEFAKSQFAVPGPPHGQQFSMIPRALGTSGSQPQYSPKTPMYNTASHGSSVVLPHDAANGHGGVMNGLGHVSFINPRVTYTDPGVATCGAVASLPSSYRRAPVLGRPDSVGLPVQTDERAAVAEVIGFNEAAALARYVNDGGSGGRDGNYALTNGEDGSGRGASEAGGNGDSALACGGGGGSGGSDLFNGGGGNALVNGGGGGGGNALNNGSGSALANGASGGSDALVSSGGNGGSALVNDGGGGGGAFGSGSMVHINGGGGGGGGGGGKHLVQDNGGGRPWGIGPGLDIPRTGGGGLSTADAGAGGNVTVSWAGQAARSGVELLPTTPLPRLIPNDLLASLMRFEFPDNNPRMNRIVTTEMATANWVGPPR
ncbi:hypothetical protein VaNZ11_009780 [Volvox africanus]|uniref:Uncharacterized protein n=1 Tax=Volvox africanus TaxID=51714 RepID=A0ABQ5S889_9CHLO|nr:hypothetical protein VaNZ11_009780 [Volvox africanus]